jgi:hypothetical protein
VQWDAVRHAVNDVEAALRTAHCTDYRHPKSQAAGPGDRGRTAIGQGNAGR